MSCETIFNPETNRWVKRTGKIGKKLLAEGKAVEVEMAKKKAEKEKEKKVKVPKEPKAKVPKEVKAKAPKEPKAKEPKDRYIPPDIMRLIAKKASTETKQKMAILNKEVHAAVKDQLTSYGKTNGKFLLRFLQNLDTLVDKSHTFKYDKKGFSEPLLTMSYKEKGHRYANLIVLKLFNLQGYQRVCLISTVTHYKRPDEKTVFMYDYIDSLNFQGKKLSDGINPLYSGDLSKSLLLYYGLSLHTMLNQLQKLTFGNAILENKPYVQEWNRHLFAS